MRRYHVRMFRAPRLGLPRLTFMIVLLALTLAVASALAWQAHQAAESHRDAAERVLRDYAEVASWEFSRAARRELDTTFDRWLQVIGCAARSAELPMPWELGTTSGCRCDDLKARTLFRMSLDGSFVSTGEPLDEDTRRWVVVSQPPAGSWQAHGPRTVRIASIAGRTSLLAARPVHDSAGRTVAVAGFIADPDALAVPLNHVVTKTPLLPPTLAGPRNDFVDVSARTRSNVPILLGRRSADPAVITTGILDESVGGIEYEVSLNRAAADRLVIGGLPRSRLPLLLGLLTLTAGLLVAAALQLRREHELARLRADFVSSVSHELRTPLAQIRLFSETLLLGRIRSEAEGRRSLEIIQQESRRLTHLVENVLYFSRSERGTGRLSLTPTRLADIASELVEAFAPLARSGRSEIRLAILDDVSAPVDEGAIRQILLNLLDNAVKYGAAGQTIVLSVERRDTLAVVAVEDEGPGVPEDARERIWAPYSRLTTAEAAAIAGTGIGLAVVRDLAILHGGRARVETGPRGGARFVIELPGATSLAVPAALPEGSRALA